MIIIKKIQKGNKTSFHSLDMHLKNEPTGVPKLIPILLALSI